jgi:ATP/maltotriose-dependent transcriptional regulator MalT
MCTWFAMRHGWRQFFTRVLPLLPSDVHILITSRTLLGSLWRLRSKQTLTVIDEEALAFSKLEAAQLFEHYGLTAEQSTIAVDHTRGRAASLMSFVTRLRESKLRTRTEVGSVVEANSMVGGVNGEYLDSIKWNLHRRGSSE